MEVPESCPWITIVHQFLENEKSHLLETRQESIPLDEFGCFLVDASRTVAGMPNFLGRNRWPEVGGDSLVWDW